MSDRNLIAAAVLLACTGSAAVAQTASPYAGAPLSAGTARQALPPQETGVGPGQPVAAPAPGSIDKPVGCIGGDATEEGAAVGAGCCSDLGAPCGPPGRLWVDGEYLLWRIKNGGAPPLVTASPPGDAGILGRPGTVTLFGGPLDTDAHSGGRFTVGYWLNEEQTVGLEGSYFFLGSQAVHFTAGTAGTAGTPGLPGLPVVARPFFNVISGAQDSELVSSPGLLNGSVAVASSSSLQGAELNGICNLCCSCDSCTPCSPRGYRLDLLAGFRYLQLDEGLSIDENLAVNPGVPIIGGDAFVLHDQFDTRNRFYGGQVGARAEVRRNRFFVDVLGKVALGDVQQVVEINGATAITPAGAPTTLARGGLLALPTNIGRFSRDDFAVVPEVGVNVGYQVNDHVRAFVGYTFLYCSDVLRPGDQIDLAVNPTQLPVVGAHAALIGPPRPTVLFNESDFWAQGINLGLEIRY